MPSLYSDRPCFPRECGRFLERIFFPEGSKPFFSVSLSKGPLFVAAGSTLRSLFFLPGSVAAVSLGGSQTTGGFPQRAQPFSLEFFPWALWQVHAILQPL